MTTRAVQGVSAAALFVLALGSVYAYLQPFLANAITITCFVLAVSLALMQRATQIFDIRRVTLTSVWYCTYLPMILFPAFLIFADKPAPYRTTYIFSVVSVLVSVPLGIIIVNKIRRYKPGELSAYFMAPIDKSDGGRRAFIVLTVLFGVITAVVVFYFFQIKVIPLVYMLQHPHDVDKLTMLREESFKLLDPRWSSASATNMFYAYLFLRTTIFPFLIMLVLGYFLISRQSRWLFLFAGYLLFGCFYAASSIARTPVAAIILRLAFFLYIYKKGIIRRRVLIALLILVLLFPMFVTAMGYRSSENFLDLFGKVGKRLTYTTAWGLYYYFEIFPSHHHFLYGQTMLKPFIQFFTKDFFYIENYVYKYMFPLGISSGHENDAFISNLYADFGLAGVLFGGILVGMLMQWIQISLIRNKKDIYNIALYSFMIYAFWVLNSGSITSVIFVNGVIPVLLLAWAVKLLTKRMSSVTFKPILHQL